MLAAATFLWWFVSYPPFGALPCAFADWLSKDINGVWRVMLYRQKNGNPVYVAIPHQAAEAVLAIPPMSEMYFF